MILIDDYIRKLLEMKIEELQRKLNKRKTSLVKYKGNEAATSNFAWAQSDKNEVELAASDTNNKVARKFNYSSRTRPAVTQFVSEIVRMDAKFQYVERVQYWNT